MPHFFINSKDISDGKIIVQNDYNHIVRALRARVGEKLLLIDERQMQYETIIESVKPLVARIEKSYKSTRELGFELYLAQAPLRSAAQNFIIEKATELGVAGIYPVMTDNCVVKNPKVEKWQKIAYEASKQCERASVPTVFPAAKMEDLHGFDKIIAFVERGGTKYENQINPGERVLVIIGPEGGFSQREFKHFEDAKIPMVTLGDMILKAETAVIVGLGNIIYEYNR